MIVITNILEVEKYIDRMDAVIFDLDDTLYSEKDYVRSGYRKIAEFYHNPTMAEEMWEVFESGGKAIDEVMLKYNMADQKEEALAIYRNQHPDIMLYSGVYEMIERIKKHKKIGIITDGRPKGQRAKLDALGIQVDKVIITDELGGVEFRKPNHKAFLLMHDWLKVDYKKMMYVGDNRKKDFIAPQQLGMQSVWFQNEDGIYKS